MSLTHDEVAELLGEVGRIERTIEEIAWAAGLFEGEGTCCVVRNGKSLRATVELTSTDEDVVRKFHRIMGCGKLTCRDRPPNKPAWKWYAYSAGIVIEVLTVLLPFLGERRTKEAEVVLERARNTRMYPNREYGKKL